jgi:hypothetical protein
MPPRDNSERAAERAAERTEELIALARSNPHLATRLLSELPPEQRSTLIAALARPPRKAAPRGLETRDNDNAEALPTDSQSAYSAQLRAFARSVSRLR